MDEIIFSWPIEKFCATYLACGDEVKAYVEAFHDQPKFSQKQAKGMAARMLKRPDVCERLALMSREALRMQRLDARRVLERLAQIAFADLTEVVKVRRVNCRYCWGKNHRRQSTQGEYDDLCADALVEAQRKKEATYNLPELPPGGLGFDATRPPHPDCPECNGEGHAESFIQDFDKLSDDVKPLIAGVEQTKYGLKVTLHNQMTALETLTKCFGLNQPDIVLTILRQMMPPEEKAVITIENAEDMYRRFLTP
ncbi:hypothetical protein FBF48_10560 [Streptococcus salivarius]|uniref:Terminase small subunit n=1 Tax=Streptococcus salivarius TaxID=1304 RepID=A0AAX2UZ73_STRSL|nr:terminase small subunit [Streptococcus salivarius]TNF65166.1 hypothetical protein FBF48_10560 [Streptococcus salivarius]